MDNLSQGIITLIVASAAFLLSWHQFRLGNHRIALLLLMLGGLILRVYTSSDMFLHYWDERYHALVAKNLIDNPLKPTLYANPLLPFDFRDWTQNHIWLHKQPLPLWLMASSLWLFGINEIAIRLPSIIMSTAGIAITYVIGKHFFDHRIAFLAAFFFAIHGLIIELTAGRVATDHIDIAFLFFIQLAIFLSIQYVRTGKPIFNIMVGLAMGAAILSKWLPALIVLPIWLLMVLDSGKANYKTIALQFLVLLITGFATFLPWQIYIFTCFPAEAAWESNYNIRHLHEAIEEHQGSVFYFLDKIRIIYGELIYLPLLWFLYRTAKDQRNLKRLAITIWFLIPFLFFSFARTKMQAYLLFTSPALFLITADFFMTISDYKMQLKWKWLINIVLILLIALPVRYSFERIKPFRKIERNPEWVSNLKELSKDVNEKVVLFNYANPVEAMFYTDMTVYPQLPDKETIKRLIREGYTVVINDEGQLPEELLMMDGVKVQPIKSHDSNQ
jgi:4-amino-4-deoxy-L-arabinose transferase